VAGLGSHWATGAWARGPKGAQKLKKVKLQSRGMLCLMNSYNLPISASLSPLFTQA